MSELSEPQIQVKIQHKFPINIPSMDIVDFQVNPAEKNWNGPYTFIHAADCQLGLIEKYILKKENPGWEEEMQLVSQAVQEINLMTPKPKFIVIGGDMVDSPPIGDNLNDHKAQYADFAKLFEKLDPEIKLVCVCGNHDVGDNPTPETIKLYHEQFGPDYFSFWVGGVKFSVLNSQYFKSPDLVRGDYEMQDEFINTIDDASAIHSVVFQHYPIFIGDPDEEDISFLNIETPLRMHLLERLEKAGVGYVFSGHWHRNGGGMYNNIEQVVTAALGGTFDDDARSGYRIVYVNKQVITHEFISIQ